MKYKDKATFNWNGLTIREDIWIDGLMGFEREHWANLDVKEQKSKKYGENGTKAVKSEGNFAPSES